MKGSLEIRSCGLCTVPEKWDVDMTNRINRLYYIHSGTGWYVRNGKKYPLLTGQVYFIPYMTDAVLYSDATDKLVHTWCDFRLSLPIISKDILCFDPSSDEMAKAALEVFHAGGRMQTQSARWKNPDFQEGKVRELYLRAVIYLTDRTAEASGVTQIKDEMLIKAIEFMHERLGEKIAIGEIAADCYLSEDGFIRRFTRRTGMTPYSYLKKLRVRTAELLREEGHTLEEIADRTGYADASSLLHAMKAHKNK